MTKPHIIHEGNIFNSKAQTLVNTVNCVGVMGKGIALGFRKRFPAMHDDYVQRCKRGEVRLGRPYLYRQPEPPWILNFPTKDHWRSMSRLSDIEKGLEYLLGRYKSWGIESLAMPPLGSGHGGLEWHVVGPTLHRYLSRLEIPVELYVPHGTPHEELQPAFFQPSLTDEPEVSFSRISPAWVALLSTLARLEHQRFRPRVGRMLFQKLAYFGTASGLDLGLTYSRGSYGPFAPNLKQYVSHLINNGLITETRRGNMIEVQLGTTFEAAERAFHGEVRRYEPQIDRLVDLFARMRTRDSEIASTVHFTTGELRGSLGRRPTEREVLNAVMDWKQRRKPPFDPDEVATAIRGLNVLGWIEAEPSAELNGDSQLELTGSWRPST
jgi:uncharacterized protein YwgA/O-acetyl-ADP-ribose deacetylase (regulator of RNase III)